MSSWCVVGERYNVAGFSRLDRVAHVERVEAVVVQCLNPPPNERRIGWWGVVRALWSGPRTRLAAAAFNPLPEGWNGSVGEAGEHQVLYSEDRALVRVRDREFSLPRGDSTLILLVDEMAPDVATAVESHIVHGVTTPWLERDPNMSRDEHLRRLVEHRRSSSTVQQAWLDEQTVVRDFLARPR